MPDPSRPLAVEFVLLFILILINAFFALAEMALDSVNKNRIRALAQDGSKKAVVLQRMLDEPNRFLPAIQIAITLAGFLASASASVAMSDDLGAWITDLFGISHGKEIAIVVITIVLSYVTLVLGVLYPKRLAAQHAEPIALAAARPINFISTLCKPFVWFLSASVNLLLRITRQQVEYEEEFSEEEVMSMLEVGQEAGALKEEGKKMINSIFEFDDKLAYEVMTPRTDVFLIDVNDPPEEYLDELMEMTYSRIPVYEDDTDNIIGILHIKDYLIKARTEGFDNVDIRSILRKPYFVPETKNIDSLFMDLQSTKNHIAILIDEYGGFSGIVTLEDIIEEVMGDIDDEYDEQELEIEKIGDDVYLIDGFVSLHDINEELGLELSSDNSETLGGLLIDIMGEIPDDNEHVDRDIALENCVCRILSVKERRVEKVQLTIIHEAEANGDEEE